MPIIQIISILSHSLQLPRLWLMYLSVFSHPFCPPVLYHSHARCTFNRALRTLPPFLQSRLWTCYILCAESKHGLTTVSVHRRYLAIDPTITERFTTLLLEDSPPRPLEAAKLLSLARKVSKGEYVNPEGKSPYQLLGDWLNVVEKFAEEVGLETISGNNSDDKMDDEASETLNTSPQSMSSEVIRFAGPPVALSPEGKPTI